MSGDGHIIPPINPSDGMEFVRRFFPGTGLTYDRVANLCTWGADGWWKHRILKQIPPAPTAVMDQACGTGILTVKIARRFPGCRVVGVDVTEEYLAVAREKSRLFGLTNVEFILSRAEDVLLDGTFDCITSSYLAKYAELGPLVRHAKAMLRDGGVLVMHDFTYPRNRAFARVWRFYFLLLQSLGAWKYPEWRPAFDGLPELLSQTQWTAELPALLRQAGFSGVTLDRLTMGTAAMVTARKG